MVHHEGRAWGGFTITHKTPALLIKMAKKFSYCGRCGQKIMIYRRNIRKGMIYGLIKLWKLGPCKTSELDLPYGIKSDFTTLKFWGLIYKPDPKRREIWEITKKGTDFLFSQIQLPKYVFVFNNRIMQKSDESINLIDIHPEKIDFDKILAEAQSLEDFK